MAVARSVSCAHKAGVVGRLLVARIRPCQRFAWPHAARGPCSSVRVDGCVCVCDMCVEEGASQMCVVALVCVRVRLGGETLADGWLMRPSGGSCIPCCMERWGVRMSCLLGGEGRSRARLGKGTGVLTSGDQEDGHVRRLLLEFDPLPADDPRL